MKTVHSKEVRYSCEGCEYKAFIKSTITKHQNRVHASTKYRVIGIGCLMCVEEELHVKCDFISRNEPKLCTFCNYTTTKTAYLKRHNKLNHTPNSDISKVIICTECEYQTLDPNSANKHNRAQHLGETRFYCDICGFKYFYKQNVREHIKSIHGDINARVKSDHCRKCQTNVKHGYCVCVR